MFSVFYVKCEKSHVRKTYIFVIIISLGRVAARPLRGRVAARPLRRTVAVVNYYIIICIIKNELR